jgi:hypothetical protein
MAANRVRAAGERRPASYPGGRTAAQWVCLLGGVSLVVAGVLGFVADSSFDTGSGVQGDELIVFEVNGWHNLVHIASGLLLVAGAPRPGTAKLVALVFGLTYALVTVIGLIDGNDVIGLLPINSADNVLHIALTALALFAGLASPATAR